MEWLVRIFSLIPKNAVSQTFGWLVRLQLPSPLNTWVCKGFAKLYGIDLSEAADEIQTFATLEDFFIRELKDGIRPVSDPYASPADGTLVLSQAAEQGGRALQVKGVYYNLDELVYGKGINNQVNWTWFTTVYLAPHNYHRVHSPVAGKLEQVRYFPGELWPVNETFVKLVPHLFTVNERLVFDFTLANGGKVAVAMVGALNVGRMTTPFWPNFFTNDKLFGLFPKTHDLGADAPQIDIGQEIGTFMLGSTAVVVMDERAQQQLQPKKITEATKIKMGESISTADTPQRTKDA